MTVSAKPENASRAETVAFEGEIREFIHKDIAPWRRRTEPASETAAENVGFLVERVAGATVAEIDHVVRELEAVQEILRNEGERVQREIANYASFCQATMATMKIIGDSMSQWRSTLATTTAPPAANRAQD